VSYEIPLPMSEQLLKKPIINAPELHRYLEKNGFKPVAVIVDNANARVVVYFSSELGDKDKKKLVDTVTEFYRKWVGVEK